MNNEMVRISKLGLTDLDELRKISIETFYASFSMSNTEEDMQDYMGKFFAEEKLAAEITNPDSVFYFASIGNRVIGYLKLNFGRAQTELKDSKGIEIERIYVRSEAQGKKIGQLLFDKAIEVAREHDFNYLWLGVWEKNPGAIRFYERNGLKQFATHSFRLGNDLQTDIMMKIEL